MVGAALLAGRAALKLGAGRVFVGLLAKDALQVDAQQPELMLRTPQQVLEMSTALALGPGLGQSGDAHALLAEAIARALPLVLDADALNLLAAHPVLARRLGRREAPTSDHAPSGRSGAPARHEHGAGPGRSHCRRASNWRSVFAATRCSRDAAA